MRLFYPCIVVSVRFVERFMSMRIITVHNFYQQPGGEDEVFSLEASLLRRHGYQVAEFTEDNAAIKDMYPLKIALNTFWSVNTEKRMQKLIEDFKPDLVHFHNTFPLISPSTIYACTKNNIPVVISLHNPRLICPGANLCRHSQPCEECLNKVFPWPAIRYKCYRNSYLQTMVVAAMLFFHRLLKTWEKRVSLYLVATEFYRDKFISLGILADKIKIKPYFVEDRGVKTDGAGGYVLFIGRLMQEKGIMTLLKAWDSLESIPLKIRGDGVLLEEVKKIIKENKLGSSIEIIGRLPKNKLYDLIKGAKFLIVPSEGFYETFGLVISEAFACGIPVIASRVGVMAEIVNDGINGLHFTAGDAKDLAEKIKFLWENPSEVERMGKEARKSYEEKYSPERNYQLLSGIYSSLIKERKV